MSSEATAMFFLKGHPESSQHRGNFPSKSPHPSTRSSGSASSFSSEAKAGGQRQARSKTESILVTFILCLWIYDNISYLFTWWKQYSLACRISQLLPTHTHTHTPALVGKYFDKVLGMEHETPPTQGRLH